MEDDFSAGIQIAPKTKNYRSSEEGDESSALIASYGFKPNKSSVQRIHPIQLINHNDQEVMNRKVITDQIGQRSYRPIRIFVKDDVSQTKKIPIRTRSYDDLLDDEKYLPRNSEYFMSDYYNSLDKTRWQSSTFNQQMMSKESCVKNNVQKTLTTRIVQSFPTSPSIKHSTELMKDGEKYKEHEHIWKVPELIETVVSSLLHCCSFVSIHFSFQFFSLSF